MSSLHVAIVGCGRMGQLRASASAAFGAEVVAVYDSRPDAAIALAGQFPKCNVVERQEDLDWGAIEAVFVCTPPSARGPVELEAARRGTALFVEKPIGLSAESLEPVRQTLVATAGLSAVGYMNRYRPSVQEARRRLAGATILGAVGYWANDIYKVPWWSKPEMSGGSVNEQATHLVDLVRVLVGEVETVQASSSIDPDRPEWIGTAVINVRCKGDVLCSLFYTCRARKKSIGFEVFTEAGSLRLDGWDLQLMDEPNRLSLSPPTGDRYEVFRDETTAFLEAVATDTRNLVLCDFEDAFRTQRVIDAIARAIQSGKTVGVV